MKLIPLLMMAPLIVAACVPKPPPHPMDEVPKQQTLANGDRQYHFNNGCVIVLERVRAVVKTEAQNCELYHRDIALLYASAD